MEYTIGYTLREVNSQGEDTMLSSEVLTVEEMVDMGMGGYISPALDRMDIPGAQAPEGDFMVSAHRLLPVLD